MPKVLFIAPVYNYYPILIHALQMQTYPDWEILLIHDGPETIGLRRRIEAIGDLRVRFHETDQRFNDWGHSLRAVALQIISEVPISGDHIVVTNADNYYVPGFIEQMLRGFDSDIVAVYCAMIHNHHNWKLIDSTPKRGSIDCGCMMVRREVSLAVGWRSREHHADWVYIQDIIRRFGLQRLRKIPNVLFVHN